MKIIFKFYHICILFSWENYVVKIVIKNLLKNSVNFKLFSYNCNYNINNYITYIIYIYIYFLFINIYIFFRIHRTIYRTVKRFGKIFQIKRSINHSQTMLLWHIRLCIFYYIFFVIINCFQYHNCKSNF